MASRADNYLARATECEVAANSATDSKVRQTYEELARQWRDLARQIEEIDRYRSDR